MKKRNLTEPKNNVYTRQYDIQETRLNSNNKLSSITVIGFRPKYILQQSSPVYANCVHGCILRILGSIHCLRGDSWKVTNPQAADTFLNKNIQSEQGDLIRYIHCFEFSHTAVGIRAVNRCSASPFCTRSEVLRARSRWMMLYVRSSRYSYQCDQMAWLLDHYLAFWIKLSVKIVKVD